MPAYAIAHLHTVNVNDEIVEYLRRIDATLEPFGGRFVVHGGPVDVLEGNWRGDLIVIEFQDKDHAHAWYAYQAILRLRTDNSRGEVILVDGVSNRHRATDILAGIV